MLIMILVNPKNKKKTFYLFRIRFVHGNNLSHMSEYCENCCVIAVAGCRLYDAFVNIFLLDVTKENLSLGLHILV